MTFNFRVAALDLGGSKIYKCPQCGHLIARDINGARNIMLRAFQD
ncbi:zinc ribbon domain-containing protein [Okeania sp. KiyG1]|nr:zinc ribbon domain-containing protein [Okeania sp. KiyG1]